MTILLLLTLPLIAFLALIRWALLTFAPPVDFYLEAAKTASYTVLATDQGTLFTNAGAAGAVTFTLPTIQAGLCYWFLAVAAQNVIITGSANVLVTNNAAATNINFTVVGQIIGAYGQVIANAAGTLWYYRHLSRNAVTFS